MSLFDEDKPVKRPNHELGQNIETLSVDELKSRIGMLKDEIARLEAEIAAKSSSRNVAESLFKK